MIQRGTTASAAALIAWLMFCSGLMADQLDDATTLKVSEMTRDLGRVAGLAELCRQRDKQWMADLEDEVSVEVVGSLAGSDPSGRRTADLARAAVGYFEGGVLFARDLFTEGGAKSWCPVKKGEPELIRADALVKNHRQPTNWSGLGGIK
jgi:hypothetical protein